MDYEAWRPALAAFYRREASLMSAECVKRGDPLSVADHHVIEALADAVALAPHRKLRIAA
jgi:hypothetical protein